MHSKTINYQILNINQCAVMKVMSISPKVLIQILLQRMIRQLRISVNSRHVETCEYVAFLYFGCFVKIKADIFNYQDQHCSVFAICVCDCSWHMMSGNVTFVSHLQSGHWERAQRGGKVSLFFSPRCSWGLFGSFLAEFHFVCKAHAFNYDYIKYCTGK